jgi:uncharacterized protein YkwD
MPLRRRVAAVATALAALALAAPAGAEAADCPGADIEPATGNLAQVGQATLCLLNAERTSRGLRAVTENRALTAPSVAFSARMVAENFFAHVAPDGTALVDRLVAAGYIRRDGDWIVGENIAWGQGHLATARSIVAAWMNSPGHRRNILTGEFAEIGVGVVLGTPGDAGWGATYTTDFGTVRGTAASVRRIPTTTGARARAARRRTVRCSAARVHASRVRTSRVRGKAAAAKRARTCGRAAKRRSGR